MNVQILNCYSSQQQAVNNSSTKRKFEDDSQQFVTAKRQHLFENNACQLIKEEAEEKGQLLHQLTPSVNCASPNYKPSPNAIANYANHSITSSPASSSDTITPPPSQQLLQQQQMQEEANSSDIMMLDDEYTDEDDSLQTPSYMNYYASYISPDVGDDLEDGGYTGQLERGWSEMFNEMYYRN